MKEIWKNIDGYEGVFKISNLGRIYSIKRNGTLGGIRRVNIVGGYEQISLSKENKSSVFKIHRLVATSLIRPGNKGEQVNHIDGNKRNNKVSNLEWCSAKENIYHSMNVLGHLRSGENNSTAKITEEEARLIKYGVMSPTYMSQAYGLNIATIFKIRSGKLWRFI